MKLGKLLLAALGVTVLLGALISTASAGRLESSSTTLRIGFLSVRFAEPFHGTTDCQVTLEGSLHSRTIVKNTANLIGYITRAVLGRCAAGTATILTATLPWHVRYLSFGGTLPNITRLTINVLGAAFSVIFPNGVGPCLARSTVTEPAIGEFERNTATGELTGAEIEGFMRTSCLNVTGHLESATSAPTVLNGTARLTVRLI